MPMDRDFAAARGERQDAGRRAEARRGEPRVTEAAATERLASLTLALLPLRIFLGGTFVYAGLDKLIDPAFLQTSGAGSIGAQLAEFVKVSPIAILVEVFAQPFPIFVGIVIAVAEIAIGLGVLTGFLFRLSAAAGAALSILFWLTASWPTRPYYYGPDLPYAFGLLTLAFAGHGGRFALDDWLARRGVWAGPDDGASEDRRRILQGGLLGAGAIALGAFGGTVGAEMLGQRDRGTALGGSPAPGSGTGQGSAAPSVGPSTAPAVSGGSTGATAATVLGTVADLTSQGSIAFQDPQNGDPGVLVKLPDGTVVAFDAVCTHAGCTVQFDPGSGFLICPCHGATFDPTHGAAVIAGPTNQPLAPIPITVNASTGTISLEG
ncbi:MAG: Rieske 2Fe-2S domain-containing protein [Chloroflexi bacterium]|nr:Rieske 2Fe-2S domain-containing protein [Chloroflexota bacterium]